VIGPRSNPDSYKTKVSIIQHVSVTDSKANMSRVRVTLDGVLDWILDLLTTYAHDSELQIITASLLISTIHKLPQQPPSFSILLCLHQPFLATASNSGDSSSSWSQVLSSQPPVQNRLGHHNFLQDNSSARTS
jgi:hypothetical protein